MIKSDLVDLVIQISPDNNYNRGMISRFIGMAMGDIYFNIFKQEPAFINDYLRRYSIIPVIHDSNLAIATLPVSTMQFPLIGDAVRIYSQTETDLTFVPIRMGEHELTGEVNEIDDTISFEVKGKEVFIYGLQRAIPLIIEAIPAFETLLDTDEFKLPAGQQANLIQTVKELLGVAPPRPILSYKQATQ